MSAFIVHFNFLLLFSVRELQIFLYLESEPPFYFFKSLIALLLSAINDGNRTNRSAINAIIIRVITKSTDRVAGG